MTQEKEIISKEKIAKALQRSGYLLENRLITILSDRDYMVYANDVFKDKFTGKSREIDIYAHSKLKAKLVAFHKDANSIVLRNSIVIECQNNPQPVVFFKKDQKNSLTCFNKFKYSLPRIGTLNQNQPLTDSINASIEYDFWDHLLQKENFHYNSKDVSSQYCSFSLKKGGKNEDEWFASHPDGLYETFIKLFQFTNEKAQRRHAAAGKQYYFEVFYPVIVLQGSMFEAEEINGQVNLTEIDWRIFEFNYYDETSDTLLVDIMTEKYLTSFLEKIEQEKELVEGIYTSILEEIKVSAGI